MQLQPGKKVYFLSDFHLGAPNYSKSLEREKEIVRFLDEVSEDAHAVFLVGDMFDFWYEYRKVVPKGFVRILGKLAEISDRGIELHFFVGNHDMWIRTYFQEELGMKVYFHPESFTIQGKTFLVGHGDGLGPKDHGYKALKKVFRSPLAQWMFGALPPGWGIGLANYFSRKSREADKSAEEHFHGEEDEWLVIYSREQLQQKHFDYFIFGHRHLPIDFRLNDTSRYINLGEWINYCTYAVFDGEQLVLRSYTGRDQKIYRNW